MQVLTGQYTKIFTHKFRVFYDDFIVDSSTRLSVNMVTIPRAYELLTAKIWVNQSFVAPGMSTCNLYTINGNNLSLGGEAARSPIVVSGLQAPSDFSGTIGSNPIPIGGQLNPNDWYLRMITNSIGGGAALTAGEVDVWLTVAKYS